MSSVGILIQHPSIDPQKITVELGITPTTIARSGEPVITPIGRKTRGITSGLRGVILTMMSPRRLVFALTTCLRRSEIIETSFAKLFRMEGEQFLSFAPKVVGTCTANLTRQY
jgi:hypothetical protein